MADIICKQIQRRKPIRTVQQYDINNTITANTQIAFDDDLLEYTTINYIVIQITAALAGGLKLGIRTSGKFNKIGDRITIGGTQISDNILARDPATALPLTAGLVLWYPKYINDTANDKYNQLASFGDILAGYDFKYYPRFQLTGVFDTAQTATAKMSVEIGYNVLT